MGEDLVRSLSTDSVILGYRLFIKVMMLPLLADAFEEQGYSRGEKS
jgi:hypothetical protein